MNLTSANQPPLARVIHLVPRDGLGGVEAAVRSLRPEDHQELAVFYMAGPLFQTPSRLFKPLAPTRSLSSPMVYWTALRRLLGAQPEVLVCSLWRATAVGILAKVLMPRMRLVVMIHSNKVAHLVDRIFTGLGCRLASEVWCDSEASGVATKLTFGCDARPVSFLIETERPASSGERAPLHFVYWGRHAHQKDVPRAVRLFNRILAVHPEARFFIYGRNGPATGEIRDAISEAADPNAITLMGAKPPGEFPHPIERCTFFLMTSRWEGMAISVVEAMQLGLIPVVTPVGEIANYCRAHINAVIVNDDEAAAREVLDISANATIRKAMSAAAVAHWLGVPAYSTDFGRAYAALLADKSPLPWTGDHG